MSISKCDAEKETKLRPLGDVVELVQAMGLNVTYAYDDLAFIEHNAFLFRFDEGRKLSLFFNEDCPEEDAKKLEQQIVSLSRKGNLSVNRRGIFSMKQIDGESNLEIRLIDA